MKTQQAIDLAGTAKALADLLNITPGAVSQWGEDVPDARVWQLQVVRPDWFPDKENKAPSANKRPLWNGIERRIHIVKRRTGLPDRRLAGRGE